MALKLEPKPISEITLTDIWLAVERVVDVAPARGPLEIVDFVSRSPTDPPCFACCAYSVSKPESAYGGVYARLAWVEGRASGEQSEG